MIKLPSELLFFGLLFGVGAFMPGLTAEPDSSQSSQAEDTIVRSAGARLSGRSAASSWNASVSAQNRLNTEQWSASALDFRVYDGFAADGHDRARRQPAYGVDVNARLEKCADGNIYISALDIGGLLYEPADGCRVVVRHRNEIDSVSGADSDAAPRTEATAAGADKTFTEQPADGKSIDCDPGTWSCRTVGQ